MENYSINPSNDVISTLIPRGFLSKNLTTIYGNAASGKTTSCLLAAISCVKNNGKVIFIDTEAGFDTNRFKQLIGEDIDNVLEKIFLNQPKTFEEQHQIILKLHKLCENAQIKLVIVDTIGKHYRVELSKNPKKTNQMMLEQLKTLVRIARDLNKVVILTNQVYTKIDEKNKLKMVGGTLIPHMSKCIIELNKKDDNRCASVVKYKMLHNKTTYFNLGKKVNFEIKENGLILV